MSTRNQLVGIMKLVIFLAFILFFIAITQIFNLTLLEDLIVLGGIIFLYVILSIMLEGMKSRPRTKIIVKEKPIMVKEKVKIDTNYIGSTQTKTYHKNTCRFAGMMKNKFLIKDNNKEYFKKLKFKACKTCKPNKN